MKKIRWATHKSLFGQIASSVCLIGLSSGLIFGIAGGTFKLQTINLSDADIRLDAAINHNSYSQNIVSQWNVNEVGEQGKEGYKKGVEQSYNKSITPEWWAKAHGDAINWKDNDPKHSDIDVNKMGREKVEDIEKTTDEEKEQRKKYAAFVLDGATHTAMDNSFNQGIINGVANFIANYHHTITSQNEVSFYKPAQDTTQEFVNIYRAAARKSRILVLGGFNNVTPLNTLGKNDETGRFKFDDEYLANEGLVLLDGDVANNQNISSVTFKSDQPAFLTAIATAMYFLNNLHLYHNNYQDIKVAAYGGGMIPTVMVYMGGFQRGVEFFNEFILKESILFTDGLSYLNNDASFRSEYFVSKLLPASKYKDEVEQIKKMSKSAEKTKKMSEILNKMYDEFSVKFIKLGDFPTHFSGTFNAGDGIGITKQYLNRGASAIIAVAGPQTLDSVQEVMNQNSNCIVIGVDTPSENSDYQKPYLSQSYADKTVAPDGSKSAHAGNIIKFSAVKDMGEATNKIIRLALNGQNWDIDNDPWDVATAVPNYKNDQILPFDYLAKEFNPTNRTFDIVGFTTENLPEDRIALKLPTVFEYDGNTYTLARVGKKTRSETVAVDFNAKTLKQFEALTIDKSLSGAQTTIDPAAFDFSQPTAYAKQSGFKYIDFSKNPNISGSLTSIPSFKGIGNDPENPVYHKGVIKFSDGVRSEAKHTYYSEFIGENSNWGIVEPHPMKSTCSFGFKTCGNIENGLISISWDGWYYLLEGLRQLEFASNNSFMQLFAQEARNYKSTHEDQCSATFWNAVTSGDYKQISTFSHEFNDIYKNYSHITLILSNVFRNNKFSFPNYLTVLLDEAGNPYTPTSMTDLSIIDWLKYNLYFIV